ncbi:unnamed protein product [Allacma fusca]|uniref:Uncharacterized protein n=1 Tax=Allacma fusca TaxID=39272 RepID=A0A8J2NTB7_9HEXA|nr:unnamed protein product [Allacma fusca]
MPYFESDCYTSVLEGDTVCLGFVGVFKALATEFLTDVNGNSLFMTAQDSYFPFYAGFAVSRYFPQVVETLENIIHAFDSMGLNTHWFDSQVIETKKKGRTTAKQRINPAYNPASDDKDEGVLFAKLLAKILVIGLAGSAFIFVGEISIGLHSWYMRRHELFGFLL